MISSTISHYKILEKLGGGGMGVVYKAQDLKLDRLVALKFLPTSLSFDDEAKQRFIHEAKSASSLQHNNICTIHEIDETVDGQLFISMDLYEGETLKKKIEKERLELEEIVNISIQIAEGLKKAHDKGIVHRDIKPANVFITNDSTVKILDFGLAKGLSENTLTQKGMTFGTTTYMSPEQARGEKVDQRTDIWSLGILFYEMLTGDLPFKGEYDQAVIYSILNEEPEFDEKVKFEKLKNIIKRCLAKNKNERYRNAEELIEDLKNGQLSTVPKTRLDIVSRKRRWFGLVSIVGLALITVFLVVYFFSVLKVKSEQRIPIAVVDFKNATNEAELNGLSGMLITALEQSKRLNVITRSRLFDILKQLGKENLTRIDEYAGKEICTKANISTLAIASIRKFGKVYTIDMKVLDVGKNQYLFAVNVRGEGKESIPDLIDKLSEKTREELNENIASIYSGNKKIAEITTPNLQAYQHFFKGEELIDKLKFKEAQKEFEQAIKLDSSFGLAYYRMAYAIDWESNKKLANKYVLKAYSLFQNIPEKEQYLVDALYAENKLDLEEALKILKEGEKKYPNDKEILYNIGDWSYHAGYLNQAEKYLNKVLQIDPNFPRALDHLTWTYEDQKRYDKMLETAKRYYTVSPTFEASSLLDVAYFKTGEYQTAIDELKRNLTIHPGRQSILALLARCYVYLGNAEKADSVIEHALKNIKYLNGSTNFLYQTAFGVLIYQGKYHDALKFADMRIKITEDTSKICLWHMLKAITFKFGWNDSKNYKAEVKKGLEYPKYINNPVSVGTLSLYYIQNGKPEKAYKIYTGKPWILTLKSVNEIKRKNYLQALTFLDSVKKYNSETFNYLIYYPLVLLQIDLGYYNEALKTLTEMLNMCDDLFLSYPLYYPKIYFLRGAVYEKIGNKSKAKENYKKFLNIWKYADKDLPWLIEAKKILMKI